MSDYDCSMSLMPGGLPSSSDMCLGSTVKQRFKTTVLNGSLSWHCTADKGRKEEGEERKRYGERRGKTKGKNVQMSLVGCEPNLWTPQTLQNLASFITSHNFEPPTFENAARHPNSETKVQCCDDHPMSSPSLTPLRKLSVGPYSQNCTVKTC